MKKKLLTVALAAVMTVSSALSAFAAETLTGTAWWTGSQTGQDYAMTDNKVTLVVETSADAGAFSVEAYNPGTDAAADGYYFTTGSDGNGWFAELLTGTVSSPFADAGADPAKFVAGNTYEVTVSVDGSTLKMEYYDATAGQLIYTMTGTADAGVTIPELKVHVMAQVGTFTVSEKVVETPAAGEDTTTAAGGEDTTTAAGGENTTTAAGSTAGTTTTPNTGDATMVGLLLAVAAVSAVVVLKKRTVAE